jgi:hypothetical protein
LNFTNPPPRLFLSCIFMRKLRKGNVNKKKDFFPKKSPFPSF